MHKRRGIGRRRQRHRFGAERLHRVEALAPPLEQDADQVDQHVGAARRGLDRARIAQVRLHRVDLADPAERLQMAGEFRPAHRDADAVAALAERADHVAAEEARAAVDRDQRVDIGLGDVGLVLPCALVLGLGAGWCRGNTRNGQGCTGPLQPI